MAPVRVVIQDHTHSKKTTVELPDDVTMQRLLPALAARMGLPAQQGGNPIVYRLDQRSTGRRLDDEETLRTAGVQSDELLTLLPEVTAASATIDEIRISSTETKVLPRRRPSWQSGRETGHHPVVIRLHDAAFHAIDAAASASDDEVGGILIGSAREWLDTLYVDIEAALPAERTSAGPAHVTFTTDSWAGLLERKEREIPDRWIVGWYHSHPRMGIFLSQMDSSLHRDFFRQPWHVAMVINGQDRTAGFFAWDDDRITPVRQFSYADPRRTVTFDFDNVPATYDIVDVRRSRGVPLNWLIALGAGAVLLIILGTAKIRGVRS